jgi:uncharacterized membrane protein
MKKLTRLLSTIFIGGVAVIFPLVVLVFFFTWLYGVTTDALRPVALQINQWLGISVSLAAVLSVAVILIGCFVIGLIVRTKVGNFMHDRLERHFLGRIPGYRLIREAARPFFNTDKKTQLFTRPALIRPYDNETLMTAFITDHHPDSGIYTAFVPTSPNPTNGLVFHVSEDRVQFVEAGFEETMRSVVAGGAGTSGLLDKRRDSEPA